MAFLVILAVLVFIVLVLVSRIRIVPQANVYVVERLGAFYKAWGTGIHFLVPFIDRVAKRVSIKEQVVDFKPQAVITKDNVTMQIDTVVFFQITNSVQFAYGVEHPIAAIENLTATTLRNIIGELELDGTLTSPEHINSKIRLVLDEATDAWGIKINRVEVKNINPPEDIQMAMEKQMRAEENKTQHRENQSQTNHGRSPFVAALSAVGTSRIGVTFFGFPRGFSGGVTVSDFQRCSRERIGCLNMTRGPAKRITSEIFSRYAGL